MKQTKNPLLRMMLLILAAVLCLAGCGEDPEPTNPNAGIESLTQVLTEEEFASLEAYPDLKTLDVSGSTCYDAIFAYIEAHPEVAVTYTVSLGDQVLSQDTTELTLEAGSFDFDELMFVLDYLPEMSGITLPSTDLTSEQLGAICAAHPGITVDYTVEMLGEIYSPDVTELDLSGITSEDVAEVTATLPALSSVTYVELMDAEGTSALTKADVNALQDALPTASFHYTFEFFGQTLSTTDESVVYYDKKMGNEAEPEIREILDILDDCTYFKLDNCKVTSEVMSSIRDDYPDTKVVWRIWCSYFTMCTDETMVRMTFDLDNTNCSELKYCTDVTYMDVGHDVELTDISFVQYMPNLECLIVSGSPLTDISYLADHDKLTWLECCFCNNLSDISCLSTCDNLKFLNVSYTKVSDLSSLENLPLERFNCMNARVSTEAQAQFEEWHPDCLIRWEGKQPYGYGWRYDDYGYTFFEYYANMRIVFRYDDTSYYGNKKER